MPNFIKNYPKEKGRELRNKQRKKYYSKTAIYDYRQWTPEEDKYVLEHTMNDHELSRKIERSVQSIQNRRCKLKKAKKM